MSVPVKICGITCREDALAALACGAEALGFIFYKPSPRYVPPERARAIGRDLPVVRVGVMVDESAQTINHIAEFCALDRIQLHGKEPASLSQALNRPAYRAFRLRQEAELIRLQATSEPLVLLDTYHPALRGGTGQTFNWEWAKAVGQTRRVILAGGLTPENVACALRRAQPAALDVSSGVEASPGIKDKAKLAAFFAAIGAHPFPSPSPWKEAAV